MSLFSLSLCIFKFTAQAVYAMGCMKQKIIPLSSLQHGLPLTVPLVE